jgi:homoserine kinase type II
MLTAMHERGALTEQEVSVLAKWGIRDVSRATLPESGVMNRVVLIEAHDGRFFLRGYRRRELDRIACEHAIIAHAQAQGVPTPEPLRLPDGATVLDAHGRYWSLFPPARGGQVPRDRLDPRHAAAMGEFLRYLQQALLSFHDTRLRTVQAGLDTEAALTRIDQLIALAEGFGSHDPVDRHALERLRTRRDWLRSGEDAGVPEEFWALPVQATHGDYQENNLFFDHRGVSSVIDWDKAIASPCAWEVVRALDLAWQLQPELSAAFLRGYYREDATSVHRALAPVALAYSSLRAHDLWLYETVYRDGNLRARTWITSGPFIPFAARWEAFWRRVEPLLV